MAPIIGGKSNVEIGQAFERGEFDPKDVAFTREINPDFVAEIERDFSAFKEKSTKESVERAQSLSGKGRVSGSLFPSISAAQSNFAQNIQPRTLFGF